MITVPLLSIFGAFALADALRGLGRLTRESPIGGPSKTLTLTLIGTVLMVGTLLPSSVSFWAPGFPASLAMEPLEHAGEYLMSLPLPDGKILVSESPIAAYFSGYPPDRILGSRWLPDNRSAALTFLKATAAYIVYVGVPYYKLRQLFPVLQDGTTTLDFKLLYDAGGIQAGTHAVFVYGVTP